TTIESMRDARSLLMTTLLLVVPCLRRSKGVLESAPDGALRCVYGLGRLRKSSGQALKFLKKFSRRSKESHERRNHPASWLKKHSRTSVCACRSSRPGCG